MDMQKFFCHHIHSSNRINNLYDKIISEEISQTDLTKPEADILIFIANNPDFKTATEIVKYRGLSKSYVSKALDPLLQKGYLKATRNDSDRRVLQLDITQKADKNIEIIRNAQKIFFTRITASLTEDDLKTYISILNKFLENA